MFKKGDLVLYKNIGVCRITDITTLDFLEDLDQKFYVMESVFKNGVNYVPLNKDIENIREIVSKDEIDRVIIELKKNKIEPLLDINAKQMTKIYEDLLNSGDIKDILKLSISIDKKRHVLEKENKKIGAIDENFYRKSMEIFLEEVAASLDKSKDEALKYIETKANYSFTY